MFGYVNINKDELKVKDFERYRAYYCGLCHELKRLYGIPGQITLSYDMTFLVIFLTGLYESVPKEYKKICNAHPLRKHTLLLNEFSEYAASMNILLSYNNLRDDWKDDKKISSAINMAALKRQYGKICSMYERQAEAVETYMKHLSICENSGEKNLDTAAGLTGSMLSEIFVYREDCWSQSIRKMAFFLGKFIYMMDAYEDVYKDKKTGNYNPLVYIMESDNFDKQCELILTMMAAECSKEFERLPVIYEADIIRNVLYSGIWTKYEQIKEKRKKEQLQK